MDVKTRDNKTVMTEEENEKWTVLNEEKPADDKESVDDREPVNDKEPVGPEMSVEEAFERLEVLLEELEKPDQPLEEAFASYEEGMKLVQFCSDALDRVEKKVLVLSGNGELDEF
ncbi:MAG: exodeoxyribonuclease VII small subunit [Lachnospiraceae bacterium]|nr:exodeoxyribonuclease VII small subunit [Lachnospiraceae bacterium]